MNTEPVCRLDPELAYLVLLTDEGIKPMSRWEKSFLPEEFQILQKLGLKPRVIERRVKTGKIVQELIFGRIGSHLDIYQRRFAGNPIEKSPETAKLEGFLFGYPCCCVEEFIRKGYQKNGFHPEDQNILFHWACRECRVTPLLLPDYHRLWRECQGLFSQPLARRIPLPLWKRLSKRVAVIATTACLVFAPGLATSVEESDPHLIPVAEDRDSDGLKDSEEGYLNTDPDNPDTDEDGVLDGIQVAREIWETIQGLPRKVTTAGYYAVEYSSWGLETCEICGQTVNMGYIEVVNGTTGLSMQIPYIALHYLEHGSLGYDGDLHDGRVDPVLFNRIINTDPHFLPIENDTDSDGLTDAEEPYFNLDSNNADTDSNGVLDGVQLAQQMHDAIENLKTNESETEPYKVEYMMRGLEECEICGQWVNMGYIVVVNPRKGLQMEIPCIALHYMEHGSFGYRGDFHKGRIDPVKLTKILGLDSTSVKSASWGRIKKMYR
ncbi:MAG: hypothetical protein KAV99_00950 [Candidatus Latescibacteria bacterium]|nr:hypothetical protein [Candidatus Latescibacterota bacterium]